MILEVYLRGVCVCVYANHDPGPHFSGNISILRQKEEGLENEKVTLLRVADTSFLTWNIPCSQ